MIYVLSGGGKLLSIIAVTYPAGSICTCSDGTKTLKAKDTSGKALFNVPVGTWTVNCTDGSRTASKAVSITENGQSESVKLSYELVLFDNGVYASETGGWNGIIGNNLVASVAGVASGEDGYGYFTSKNAVDLSGYKTIYFTIYSFTGTYEAHNGTLSAGGSSLSLPEGASGTKSFDISSVSSGVIKGVAHAWGGGSNCTLQVSKIWLT